MYYFKDDRPTRREKDMLRYCLFTQDETARILCIAQATVASHRRRLFQRLSFFGNTKVTSMKSAMVEALKRRYIRLDEIIMKEGRK